MDQTWQVFLLAYLLGIATGLWFARLLSRLLWFFGHEEQP